MGVTLEVMTATTQSRDFFNNLAKGKCAFEPVGATNALSLGISLDDYDIFLSEIESGDVKKLDRGDRKSKFSVTLETLSSTSREVMHKLLDVNNKLNHRHYASVSVTENNQTFTL